MRNLSLTCVHLRNRDTIFIADHAPARHDPEQNPCREGGVAVDGVRTSGSVSALPETHTLPGEGKIFSLCLDSFAPRSSRALRTCMVNSNPLCYLSPSLSCPTVGFQPVTWPCGARMRESMLTYWELWAHGSMKIASALALGAKENTASPRGTRQAHSHWPDRGTVHGIRLSTLN